MSWRWHVSSGLSQKELWCQGEIVSDGDRVKVVRFEVDGCVYFRKESSSEQFGRLLERVTAGGSWCSMPEQEARNLNQLDSEGFCVVPVVAAGSHFRFGLPVKGVMVTAALDAPLLESVLGENPELWLGYGKLVGRLHCRGYFDDCRAKDVLVDHGRMVLLDREKSRSGKRWNYQNALKSLRRTSYRNQRSGIQADAGALAAFWAGYAEGAKLDDEKLRMLQQKMPPR